MLFECFNRIIYCVVEFIKVREMRELDVCRSLKLFCHIRSHNRDACFPTNCAAAMHSYTMLAIATISYSIIILLLLTPSELLLLGSLTINTRLTMFHVYELFWNIKDMKYFIL